MTSTPDLPRTGRARLTARAVASALALVTAGMLAGCGTVPAAGVAAPAAGGTTGAGVVAPEGWGRPAASSDSPTPPETASRPTSATVTATGAPARASIPVAATPPDPCAALPGQMVAAWAGGPGQAVVTGRQQPTGQTTRQCSWRLPDTVRAGLVMAETNAASADVTVTFGRYDRHRHGTASAPWWSPDESTLIRTYADAQRSQKGAAAVTLLPGRPRAVQSGTTTLIAQDGQRWVMVTFHGCRPDDCGKQATGFARQLSASIAVGLIAA